MWLVSRHSPKKAGIIAGLFYFHAPPEPMQPQHRHASDLIFLPTLLSPRQTGAL
jgi:hypothetical protein